MGRAILIDSGPIVAALRERDSYHVWARTIFAAMEEACMTCEAVISECFHLLEANPRGHDLLCSFLRDGRHANRFHSG